MSKKPFNPYPTIAFAAITWGAIVAAVMHHA